MLRVALATAGRDPRLGGLLQQSLGRAADARAPARRRRLRRVRDRHEPRRRDHAAGRAWCARTSRSSPRSRRCISSISARSRKSPTPRRKFSPGSNRGGAAVLNRDAPQFERLAAAARARGARVADLRRRRALRRAAASASSSERRRIARPRARARARTRLRARRAGACIWLRTRSACCSPADALGADVARRGGGARRIRAAEGARRALHAAQPERPVHGHRRELQRQSRLDARRAGAARRGASRARAGRRIAVIGDMLELGPDGATMHAALAAALGAQPRRSALRRGAADARALRRRARGDARRLGRAIDETFCANLRERAARRRRRHGQGFERQPHGAGGGGACANDFHPPRRDAVGTATC